MQSPTHNPNQQSAHTNNNATTQHQDATAITTTSSAIHSSTNFAPINLAHDSTHKDAHKQIRVFITHGFDSHPHKNWFQWLIATLQKQGIHAQIFTLPTPAEPKLDEWIQAMRVQTIRATRPHTNTAQELESSESSVDERTFFVAHSLGCIATLRFIERLDSSAKIGGIVLVSGFYEPLAILPQLAEFVKSPLQGEKIARIIKQRCVIAARDDEIVPFVLSQNLARAIGADFITQEKGGHFMDCDGFVEFPLVYELLYKQILASKNTNL